MSICKQNLDPGSCVSSWKLIWLWTLGNSSGKQEMAVDMGDSCGHFETAVDPGDSQHHLLLRGTI